MAGQIARLSSPRGRMPLIPEEDEEMSPAGALLNANKTDNADGPINTHKSHNTNRDDDFMSCPQSYSDQLKALPTEDMDTSEPVLPENTVRPMEAYIKETDKLIKKLLADIAKRENS